MNKVLVALAALVLIALSGHADSGAAVPARVSSAVGRVPSIQESRPGDPDPYVLRDRGLSAWFGDSCIAISAPIPGSTSAWGLHWGPVDAAMVAPRAVGETQESINYMVGEPATWKSRARSYSRINYPGIRPGITLIIEPRRRGLKYGLEIESGSSVQPLRFRYDGATELRLDPEGLDIVTGAGTLRESGLACHQLSASGTRIAVSACYGGLRREGPLAWSYELEIGAHDPALPLIVDPVVGWASYLGGSGGTYYGQDGEGTIDVDAAGNVTTSMMTSCTTYPFAIGGYDTGFSGIWDILVTRTNASCTAVTWSTYLGGTGDDRPASVAVDSSGAVVVSGFTQSFDYPVLAAIQPARSAASEDGVLTRLSADGETLAWSTHLGEGKGIPKMACLDAAGNIYVVSYTASAAFPGIATGANPVKSGYADSVISKVAANGSSILWSTYVGGSWADGLEGMTEADNVKCVAIDPAGNLIVAGETNSRDFIVTPDVYDPTVNGALDANPDGTDAFLMKLAPGNGAVIWSTYYGGTDEEIVDDLAVDAQGCAWIIGRSRSTDLPLAAPLYETDPGQGAWAPSYVAKFRADGQQLLFASWLGGDGMDALYRIAVDAGSNAYIAGNTTGSFPKAELGFQPELGGYFDAVLLKLSPDGSSHAWSTYVGGLDGEKVQDLKVNAAGITLCGDTFSTDFPATSGVVDASLGGGSMTCDAFLVRVADLRPVVGPSRLEFTSVEGSVPAAKTVKISSGPQALTWTVQCAAPWVTLTGSSGSLAAGISADLGVSVNPAGLASGIHTALITVSDSIDAAHPQQVQVVLTVTGSTASPTGEENSGRKKGFCSAAGIPGALIALAAIVALLSRRAESA